MFLFRNRLAFGAVVAMVFGAIKVGIDIVYKVLKLLKLQLLLAVLFIGAILFLTKVLPENTTLLVIFIIFLAIGFIYAVYGNVSRIKKFFVKFKRNKDDKNEDKQIEPVSEKTRETVSEEKSRVKTIYPKYYSVSQNKNYIMAEYSDKYVLYKKKDGKLYKIRTDYKENA